MALGDDHELLDMRATLDGYYLLFRYQGLSRPPLVTVFV